MMMMMMVNVCDDAGYLVMKVIFIKEVISCDVLPVAMFKSEMGIFCCISITNNVKS